MFAHIFLTEDEVLLG